MTQALLILGLLAALLATFPIWPYNRRWGYTPMGVVMAVFVVALLLIIAGQVWSRG